MYPSRQILDWMDRLHEKTSDFRQPTVYPPPGASTVHFFKIRVKCGEGLFLKWMWRVKKPRLKMNTSQLPTESSSLAVPNISFYIWVCHA